MVKRIIEEKQTVSFGWVLFLSGIFIITPLLGTIYGYKRLLHPRLKVDSTPVQIVLLTFVYCILSFLMFTDKDTLGLRQALRILFCTLPMLLNGYLTIQYHIKYQTYLSGIKHFLEEVRKGNNIFQKELYEFTHNQKTVTYHQEEFEEMVSDLKKNKIITLQENDSSFSEIEFTEEASFLLDYEE